MIKLSEGIQFANRYRLLKRLGQGGFSEVWLAEDVNTNIKIAIKIYAPGMGVDDDGIDIFRKEFSLVFDMNHTNLLRPTFFDLWERMPYLILPYCANGSAFKFMQGSEQITEDESWNLLHDVAAGLAYLHSKNPPVIHQDIKPDNILISDEGHYMITDFGISSRARNTIRRGGVQEQSVGTLAYMAPERFSAKPKPIMASDIWSLGAMMYELITKGQPPFGNYGGAMQKNGAEIPAIDQPVSQELKDIIYRCLALNTWDRPSGAEIEEITYRHLHGFGSVPWMQPIPPSMNNSLHPDAGPTPYQGTVQGTIQSSYGPGKQPISSNSLPPTQSPPPPNRPAWLKWWPYAAAVAAVLMIVTCIIVCTGRGKDGEAAEEQAVVVDYDAMVTPRFEEALALEDQGDIYIKEENPYDAEKEYCVEDPYIEAYQKYQALLADTLMQHISPELKDRINTHVDSTKGQLKACWKGLSELATLFADDNKYGPIFQSRVLKIEAALTSNSTNEPQNN